MTRRIPFPSQEFSEFQIEYIRLWRSKKKYAPKPYLSAGDIIELLLATTYSLEKEGSDTRFFNYVIHNDESVIAWDGEDPIDIWLYQVKENINFILARGRTFNDIIDK